MRDSVRGESEARKEKQATQGKPVGAGSAVRDSVRGESEAREEKKSESEARRVSRESEGESESDRLKGECEQRTCCCQP